VQKGRSNRKPSKKKKDEVWKWKKIPPKEGELQQKQVRHPKSGEMETYNWCPAHQAWTQHDPNPNALNGCRKAKEQKDARKQSNSSGKTSFARAMLAVIQDYEDEMEAVD